MVSILQLLHLTDHGGLGPFLAGAGDGRFLREELLELAADSGCVVVAGNLFFDFF